MGREDFRSQSILTQGWPNFVVTNRKFPKSFVDTPGSVLETLCQPGEYQDQLAQTSCKTVDPGFFTANAGSASQTPCPAGTSSLAGATSCFTLPQNTGPIIAEVNPSVIASGELVTVTGSRLETIDRFEITGLSAVADCEDTNCTFVAPRASTIWCEPSNSSPEKRLRVLSQWRANSQGGVLETLTKSAGCTLANFGQAACQIGASFFKFELTW